MTQKYTYWPGFKAAVPGFSDSKIAPPHVSRDDFRADKYFLSIYFFLFLPILCLSVFEIGLSKPQQGYDYSGYTYEQHCPDQSGIAVVAGLWYAGLVVR